GAGPGGEPADALFSLSGSRPLRRRAGRRPGGRARRAGGVGRQRPGARRAGRHQGRRLAHPPALRLAKRRALPRQRRAERSGELAMRGARFELGLSNRFVIASVAKQSSAGLDSPGLPRRLRRLAMTKVWQSDELKGRLPGGKGAAPRFAAQDPGEEDQAAACLRPASPGQLAGYWLRSIHGSAWPKSRPSDWRISRARRRRWSGAVNGLARSGLAATIRLISASRSSKVAGIVRGRGTAAPLWAMLGAGVGRSMRVGATGAETGIVSAAIGSSGGAGGVATGRPEIAAALRSTVLRRPMATKPQIASAKASNAPSSRAVVEAPEGWLALSSMGVSAAVNGTTGSL